ncbi:uncharacterized protein HD556DRAFT_1223631 [Suillus plorans]|uniref:Crinkler effector protein N-terminal domain-containing protein n=1 Tax=Suillus plorans TaxID=116603 RepID=A0A9P7JA59_9AGAM|nr:uncharacterized protein HD556DRAFT_1223631 [Suillus plorans]KAG1810486.1 hypothetical protein HD556DRAFT_1223631 [Suillus plorans]
MYILNCIVLGHGPSHTFEIKIEPTESVSALRKAIKDAKKPHFDHVAADDLALWRVDLPADEAPKNHTLDPKQSLSAVAKLSKFFSEQPNEEHLHIVVQGPPAVSSGPLHLRLNCIVLGHGPSHTFEIKIAPTESVSALRKAIKDAKKPHFDHVAADDLALWRVSDLMPTIGC